MAGEKEEKRGNLRRKRNPNHCRPILPLFTVLSLFLVTFFFFTFLWNDHIDLMIKCQNTKMDDENSYPASTISEI